MLRGLHFILFEKINAPCNIGESYRCGIGNPNPYRAASIHYYQRVVHVRVVTCIAIYGKCKSRIRLLFFLCRDLRN